MHDNGVLPFATMRRCLSAFVAAFVLALSPAALAQLSYVSQAEARAKLSDDLRGAMAASSVHGNTDRKSVV